MRKIKENLTVLLQFLVHYEPYEMTFSPSQECQGPGEVSYNTGQCKQGSPCYKLIQWMGEQQKEALLMHGLLYQQMAEQQRKTMRKLVKTQK